MSFVGAKLGRAPYATITSEVRDGSNDEARVRAMVLAWTRALIWFT
jgi:hypothetical protein